MTDGIDGASLQHFINKLSMLAQLDNAEIAAIKEIKFDIAHISRRKIIINEGVIPTYLYAVVDGWAGCYSLRPDDTRRITGFLLPGDFCGIHAICHRPMEHAITALTDCTIAKFDLEQIEAAVMRFPSIRRAFWHAKLIDEAILRKWLLNSSDAYRSLAHLLCELNARLPSSGMAGDTQLKLPITQEHLADALGMTPVHVNRTIQRLRADGLVEGGHRSLAIANIKYLEKAAYFDSAYLHCPALGVNTLQDSLP